MISIIIRTLNEEKYLPECLNQINNQVIDEDVEIIVVDSGSTDKTIAIAKEFGVIIRTILKEDFTFGRSLNIGCDASRGRILVFLSAHCIPCNRYWLINLVAPLKSGVAKYTYGRQVGRDGTTKFSEKQIFAKYFPESSAVPQDGYFCNNANAAILRDTWSAYQFDETLTGLEDMELAARLVEDNAHIAYVSEASVEHIHEETWRRVKIRFEREAFALRRIDPTINLRFHDAIRMCLVSIVKDVSAQPISRIKEVQEIIYYRICQYFGSYIGSVRGQSISKTAKESYFYPDVGKKPVKLDVVRQRNHKRA